MLKGIGVSPGIGLAPVIKYYKQELIIPEGPGGRIEAEKTAYAEALEKIILETEALAENAKKNIGSSEAAIFDAHVMILQDPELSSPIFASIEAGDNAVHAVSVNMDSLIEFFESMDDAYMRERAADMRDLKTRLISALLGVEFRDLSSLPEMAIIVASDLTPSDTAKIDKKHIAGIITEVGGRTSHTAIMARAMEIPAIVGCANAMDLIEEGRLIAMDGGTGVVSFDLSNEEISQYKARIEQAAAEKAALNRFATTKSITRDGHAVEIAANIGIPGEARRAAELGADAIGLFRSEFLYMDRNTLPDEDEQFYAYKEAACAMDGRAVIVRTLDIGGDKKLPALPLPQEDNPFLGYRAIRISLDRQELFRTQLRALLRASVFGKLKIMFPMISSLDELRSAKAFAHQCMQELEIEGAAYNPDIKIGIMIEIPAAAVIADKLAQECDFFSIGTNDLIQYTVAVDRGNEKVAGLYSQYHPAVLRLISTTISAAHAAGIPCGMCGEAGGDPLLIPLLLGMGLDEFSMSASSILFARKMITELDYSRCKGIVQEVLDLPTASEVVKKLQGLNY